MTVIEEIVETARGLSAAGKRSHEVIEAVRDLGHAAGFTVIGETITNGRLGFDFYNGEAVGFDGTEWHYKRVC
jgi:hypothetical protein